jgi:hypothetical protein
VCHGNVSKLVCVFSEHRCGFHAGTIWWGVIRDVAFNEGIESGRNRMVEGDIIRDADV